MANASKLDVDVSYPVTRGFLVVRRGGRWTDLLRLSPEKSAVIGRASTNQIVIRSHQASRQHAEIRWDEGDWWVRDLGSRNGTVVDGNRVEVATRLREGSCIEVAGCAMTFVTQIADALASSRSLVPGSIAVSSSSQQLSEEQLTLEGLDDDAIIHRTSHSRFLGDSTSATLGGSAASSRSWQSLFGLAYRLASAESIEDAAHLTLETLTTTKPECAGGVFLFANSRGGAAKASDGDDSAAQAALVAFTNRDNRSYRPPSAKIVQSALQSGSAVIARNIGDDKELQDADSRGEYSVTTAIIVPIKSHSLKEASRTIGYTHIYTTASTATFESDDLEFAIAAVGILAAAIENVHTRRQLSHSLHQTRRQIEQLRERLEDKTKIVGSSEAIKHVKALISRVAKTNTTVLIRGESGVGKELVAAAIHQSSPRRDGPMVCLNCAALSPTLLESELFGHEKGAFTGATELKKGKFESAHGGTLMLDEIGEMSIDLQAKLLRVLEGHPFERLGGHQAIRVDVRLIAATNRDLPTAVQEGRFRADLYYRLNVVEIIVPPLRDRSSDILPIANHYVAHFADKTARRVDGFTQRAADLLQTHSWPGNIRELRNVVERAVVLGGNELIDVDDLNIIVDAPIHKTNGSHAEAELPSAIQSTNENAVPTGVSSPVTLEEIERQHVLSILQSVGGNKSRAAILLGIERSTLDRKLKRFNTKG